MKLVKSLILGSVAGLAAVAGAQAADLPVAKAAPVEYVRVCSTYGAGFFYIPGTDTCLRVGGRVRAEYQYLEPETRASNSIGFRARGRIQLDARTATAYGLLRTFVRFDVTHNTGTYGADTAIVDQAFVQFGGLTAGRTVSFWDNGDLPTGHFGTVRFSDAPTVNVLAYTASFGNGFSATLSLEEGRFVNGAFDIVTAPGANFGNIFAGSAITPAGQRAPDVVANVKYAGTWGTAQLSGVVHQIRSNDLTNFGGGVFDYPDSEYGWAVGIQGSVNLPMLAAGDAMWYSASYAHGAVGYLGFGSQNTVGSFSAAVADAFVGEDGDLDVAEGWQIAAGLRHYWTPEIRSNIFGSYARVEYGADDLFVFPGLVPGTTTVVGLGDFDEWRVGANVIWSPVSGLDIGAEVIYAKQESRHGVIATSGNVFRSVGVFEDDDAIEARLRVQRDF